MGASPLMSIGLRAMSASYASMEATGHNIANANVAGYSRQQAELATAKGQYTGAGFFGKGVDVKTVTRAHDAFITRAAATAKSLAALDAARQERLQSLEQVFPTGEAGIGYTTGQFLNALVDLASRPGDSATRQVVLARAEDLASRFNSAAEQVGVIQANLTADLKTSVTEVNGLADAIASLNDQIAASRGLGQPPNDLLDERDRLIAKVASQIQVSTVQADDGTMGVFIAGGQSLVLGTRATHLKVTLDPVDPSRSALALGDGAAQRVIDENALGGGAMAGLLKFQNTDLVDGRNLVGQLAAAVAGAINEQQMLGLNLQVPTGTVPSRPLFAVGGPLTIPNNNNAKDASGAFISSVAMTVVEPSALQAADYTLRADPASPGAYTLTRLSTPPLTRTIVSGDVVDGVRIDIGVPEPSLTDRFLLQPVGQAAQGLQRLLEDPRDLAAASPLVATAGSTNLGTAGVASLKMLTAPGVPDATARVTFTSDSGDYAWELFDGSGTPIASGTGVWSADEPIPTPPTDINGFELRLSGVPRTGDTLDVVPTQSAFVAANNGNALALSALRDALLVGREQLADGSLTGGAIVTDAYASAIANVGVRVQTAKSAATISAAVSQQAEAARSEVSGVNLDEEAARLIQYQQSYQAAAKVLQIAQSVFETLLQTAGA
ncbi:flagellar hook-associated protein FlgK [Rubrivivax sp. RP6-9]|uniref:flagellar hook-associated protein FlgK n=1 Tax=Rubrivivax sp. RP6-9 TaxID=3415750 RepID=UPI003CC6A606